MFASNPRLIWAQSRFEFRGILANGEQLVLNIMLPLLGLFWIQRNDDGTQPQLLLLLASIFASNFTGTAIATAFERRQGVLKALAISPLGRVGLVIAKVCAGAAISLLQLLLLLGTNALWEPGYLPPVSFWLALPILTAAAQGAALWLASALRAEAVLAIANAALIAVAVSAYVNLDLSIAVLNFCNPLSAAASAINRGGTDWLVLVTWAGAALTGAIRNFSWD